MCGIFGWLIINSQDCIDPGQGKRLTDLLTHRGPDACGYYHHDRIFLGHRRLKIIDLSDSANQPMQDSTGRYFIIFNGEIYNYLELKAQLKKSGVLFRTSSDTEVLLASYIHWGVDCLKKIEGMFAFAIYDSQDHSLFLVRDHLGQKPLYYTLEKGHFIFASELRCLLEHPLVSKKLDLTNIIKYNFFDVFPFGSTPLKNVYKVPPASYIQVNSNNELKLVQYWDSIPVNDRNNHPEDLDDILDGLDELLSSTMLKHIRTDVPMGVFLSGGIDSSLVTHYTRKCLGDDELHSFSIAVDFANFDESHIAQEVNRKYHCTPHIFHLTKSDVVNNFMEIAQKIDEPLADPGIINSRFIARQSRNFITVALAGDGGDELFGGYLAFRAAQWLRRLKFLPERLILPLLLLARKIIPVNTSYMSLDFKLQQFVRGLTGSDLTRLPRWLASFTPAELKQLYAKGLVTEAMFNDEVPAGPASIYADLLASSGFLHGAPLENILLYQYQKYFLPEFVLGHTDRASMLSALEVRCPLVDKNVAEFANRLPLNLKIKSGKLKKLLFDLAARLQLPAPVLRHPKRGFTFPVALWLQDMLKDFMADILLANQDHRLAQVFDLSVMRGMVAEHVSGRANHYRPLWNLIILFSWMKNFPQLTF